MGSAGGEVAEDEAWGAGAGRGGEQRERGEDDRRGHTRGSGRRVSGA